MLLFLSLIAALFVTAGCLNEVIGQKITVQKQTGEENMFEDFNEIQERKQVEIAKDIVKSAKWKKVKVEMSRYADYQFQFPSKNSNENKIASYILWVSPNGENVEIVTESDQYVKLTKDDSATLLEILIGDE